MGEGGETNNWEYNPHGTKEGDLGGGDGGVVPLIAGEVFQFLLDRRERG